MKINKHVAPKRVMQVMLFDRPCISCIAWFVLFLFFVFSPCLTLPMFLVGDKVFRSYFCDLKFLGFTCCSWVFEMLGSHS